MAFHRKVIEASGGGRRTAHQRSLAQVLPTKSGEAHIRVEGRDFDSGQFRGGSVQSHAVRDRNASAFTRIPGKWTVNGASTRVTQEDP